MISHVPGDLHKADLGTKGFDVPKFKSLRGLLRIIPFEIVEVTEIAMKTAKKLSNESLLMFIMVCYTIVQGARVSVNEDLQLDGWLEFYVVVGLGIVAYVAIWEMVKKIADMGKWWWMSWQRKQRRLERLRTKAEAAVNEERRRRLGHETSAPRTTSATTSRPFSHFHFHTQSDLAIMQLTSV